MHEESCHEKWAVYLSDTLDMDKWLPIVTGWDASQESQKHYCQRLGINIHTFAYVRSKLIRKEKENATFIPVVIQPPKPSTREIQPLLMLENTKGLKLYLPLSLPSEQLNHLLTLSGWQHD